MDEQDRTVPSTLDRALVIIAITLFSLVCLRGCYDMGASVEGGRIHGECTTVKKVQIGKIWFECKRLNQSL